MTNENQKVDQSVDKAMHHWMVTAQVVFTNKDASDGGAILINAMLLTEHQCVNAASLAQAQRTITANTMERMQDPNMGIVDIVFTGFSYLGYMTQAGFNPENSVKPGV